jgi:hypothetical protein
VSDLWHFTCDHGYLALGIAGMCKPAVLLEPQKALPWPSNFAWFTDMAVPDRESLGLTSRLVRCDRTQYRYRVTNAEFVRPWHEVARLMPRKVRDALEAEPGSRPMHWWVSVSPVPVVYEPRKPE